MCVVLKLLLFIWCEICWIDSDGVLLVWCVVFEVVVVVGDELVVCVDLDVVFLVGVMVGVLFMIWLIFMGVFEECVYFIIYIG